MIPASVLRSIPQRIAPLNMGLPNTGVQQSDEIDFSNPILTELSSGFSRNRVWKIASTSTPISAHFVVRNWNSETYSRSRVSDILGFQSYLSENKMAAPKPMRWSSGELVFDSQNSFWSLESWLPGKPTIYNDVISDSLLSDISSLLSDLHATGRKYAIHQHARTREKDSLRLSCSEESSGMRERITKLRYWKATLRNGIRDRFSSVLNQTPIPTHRSLFDNNNPFFQQRLIQAGVGRAMEYILTDGDSWILYLESLQQRKLSVHWILRDLWRDNILTEGDRVTGIVDFGAARIDWPMLDLVRCFSSFLMPDDARLSSALKSYSNTRPSGMIEFFGSEDSFVETFHLLDRVATSLSILYWCEQIEIADTQARKRIDPWLRLQELCKRIVDFE